MARPIETPAPNPTRQQDDFAAARSLVTKLRNIDVAMAKAQVAAEKKRRALLESASPTVRAMAEAKLAETVDVVVESGNNVTSEGDAES